MCSLERAAGSAHNASLMSALPGEDLLHFSAQQKGSMCTSSFEILNIEKTRPEGSYWGDENVLK